MYTCRHMILILYHTFCHVIYLFLHGRFYPYHYAPFVSDIKDIATLRIEFDLGTPFLPYQQLLSMLPPASKSLLPRAYQGLMLNEDSVLKEFYPVDFTTDLNGKQQDWEAVVLIPFIDAVGWCVHFLCTLIATCVCAIVA